MVQSPELLKTMVFDSVKALTGAQTHKAAWSSLFRKDDVVGLKLNCLAGKFLSSRPEVVNIIVEGLKLAGLEMQQIIFWNARIGVDPCGV